MQDQITLNLFYCLDVHNKMLEMYIIVNYLNKTILIKIIKIFIYIEYISCCLLHDNNFVDYLLINILYKNNLNLVLLHIYKMKC